MKHYLSMHFTPEDTLAEAERVVSLALFELKGQVDVTLVFPPTRGDADNAPKPARVTTCSRIPADRNWLKIQAVVAWFRREWFNRLTCRVCSSLIDIDPSLPPPYKGEGYCSVECWDNFHSEPVDEEAQSA